MIWSFQESFKSRSAVCNVSLPPIWRAGDEANPLLGNWFKNIISENGNKRTQTAMYFKCFAHGIFCTLVGLNCLWRPVQRKHGKTASPTLRAGHILGGNSFSNVSMFWFSKVLYVCIYWYAHQVSYCETGIMCFDFVYDTSLLYLLSS